MRRLLLTLTALVALVSGVLLWPGTTEGAVSVQVVRSPYAVSGVQPVAAVADRVAVVQVMAEDGDFALEGMPATRFQVRVLQVLKGELPRTAQVTQLGGPDEPHGALVMVADDTRLRPGNVALLALLDHEGVLMAIPVGGTRVLPVADAESGTWRSSPAVTRMVEALRELPSANRSAGAAQPPGQSTGPQMRQR